MIKACLSELGRRRWLERLCGDNPSFVCKINRLFHTAISPSLLSWLASTICVVCFFPLFLLFLAGYQDRVHDIL